MLIKNLLKYFPAEMLGFFIAMIKQLICILIAALIYSANVYAVDVESLDIQGSFSFSETDLQTINRIPESVVSLYHAKGGKISFVPSPLEQKYQYCDSTILGLYSYPSNRIYIRNFIGTSVNYGTVLAHELGHFLFHETFPSWSKQTQEAVLSVGGSDPDESFACLYHSYCAYGTSFNSEIDTAIHEIHIATDKLYRRTVGTERSSYHE